MHWQQIKFTPAFFKSLGFEEGRASGTIHAHTETRWAIEHNKDHP